MSASNRRRWRVGILVATFAAAQMVAACAVAGQPAGSSLAGVWRGDFVTNGQARTATMTVDEAGRYRTVFSGTPAAPDDVGVLELASGQWSARHEAGWTDRGTYRFEGPNVLVIQGVGPDARWQRISGGGSAAAPAPRAAPAAQSAPPAAATLDPALAHPRPQPINAAVDRIYLRADTAYKAHDYARALPDMREAARRGSPKAQNVLGMMYEDGHGVPKDLAQARALYEQSARQGYRSGADGSACSTPTVQACRGIRRWRRP